MENNAKTKLNFWKESWLLIISAVAFGLLLAGVQAALQPRIDQNAVDKLNASLKTLITDADGFDVIAEKEAVDFAKEPMNLYRATKNGETVGWAFTTSGAGYADKIRLLIALDGKCEKILGYDVLFSNETAGFGDKIKLPFYQDQYKGAPATKLKLSKLGDATVIDSEIVAISGATISSKAVLDIFNCYTAGVKGYLAEKGLLK